MKDIERSRIRRRGSRSRRRSRRSRPSPVFIPERILDSEVIEITSNIITEDASTISNISQSDQQQQYQRNKRNRWRSWEAQHTN
jgi:hypothetical protein